MSYKILLSFLWAALFIQTLMADEVTLQNGLNGYTGCEDSYIATNGWGTVAGFSPTANNGTNAELKVHRESC